MNKTSHETRLTLLIKLSQAGDGKADPATRSKAWAEFDAIYSPMVFQWCKKMGLRDDACHDATQEVMLKLLSVLKKFSYNPERGSFRSWLKTVTSNLVRDIQRSRGPDSGGSGDTAVMKLLAEIQDESFEAELTSMFERQYERELVDVAGALVRKRVSEKNWLAWQEYGINQKGAKEVAQQLGIPVAEVYVAKSRIAKMMREEINRLEANSN